MNLSSNVNSYMVAVKLDPVAQKTKSGIIMESGDGLRRKQAATTFGTIVGVGEKAFTGADFGDTDREKNAVGVRVVFRQFAGQAYTDNPDDPNAQVIRIMADTNVLMTLPDGKKLKLIDSE